MANRSSDDLDLDHTDELPVLREPIELGDDGEPLLAHVDDTAEHTALYDAGAAQPEVLAELATRVAEIPALEVQIRTLTDSVRDLEQAVAAKDRQIAELEAALAAERGKAGETAAAERRAAAQHAVAEGRLAELKAALERQESEAAARANELEELKAQAEAARLEAEAARRDADAARGEVQALRAELAAKAASGGTADADRLREDNAALAAYIAGRRSWWDESQAAQAELEARVATLTRELAARDKRLAAADAFAARESQRAVGLRAELVEYARRAEALERELRSLRGGEAPAAAAEQPAAQPERAPEPGVPPPAEAAPAVPEPTAASAATAAAEEQAPDEPAPDAHDASPPVLTDAVGAIPPAVETIAQLEAEVEYKRQQIAAQLVELRDREQRLEAAAAEIERARRDIAALKTELDESRAAVMRLERAVMDKDRALEARDNRIATLQEELKMRLGREAYDDPALEPSPAARAAHEESREGATTPMLICLTGDAPQRFAITKKTVTVGRGPQCDLQILTHFVSREHARLISQGGVTVIEDLGSRNGVFVNSVRVDRRQLRQGDLVTIGETQFRFVESMAH